MDGLIAGLMAGLMDGWLDGLDWIHADD